MAGDTITFAQGQTATLTAQFVTSPAGMAVDVPDAMVEILDGATSILPATAMVHVMTGFYYYDYLIPNSLPVNTYTVRYTGTVSGTPTAATEYLKIVEAGTPTSATMTQKKIELLAALEKYICCAQRVPVYRELARRSSDKTKYSLTFPRWNLGNHMIMLNNEIIEPTAGPIPSFVIDSDTGLITFSSPLHDTDRISASYNFRWFTDTDLLGFMSDALSQINLEAPGTNFNLDTVPDNYVGVLMMGATKNALKALIFCLMFQEPSQVFGGPDGAKSAIETLKSLKENNEKEFERDKKQIKKATYPRIAVVSTPEYTLPGGRSRWFRYLFGSGAG
jgi:hypothetical protein